MNEHTDEIQPIDLDGIPSTSTPIKHNKPKHNKPKHNQQGASPVPTTTDQPVTIREDRPTERTEPRHADRPVHSPPPTKPLRTTLGWFVVSIVAISAALLAVMLFDADSSDTSVNQAVVTEHGDTPVANRPTQLDVQGIPTWWSHEPAASE